MLTLTDGNTDFEIVCPFRTLRIAKEVEGEIHEEIFYPECQKGKCPYFIVNAKSASLACSKVINNF